MTADKNLRKALSADILFIMLDLTRSISSLTIKKISTLAQQVSLRLLAHFAPLHSGLFIKSSIAQNEASLLKIKYIQVKIVILKCKIVIQCEQLNWLSHIYLMIHMWWQQHRSHPIISHHCQEMLTHPSPSVKAFDPKVL